MQTAAPFGRYVLKERLARGGMGEVFRAVAVGEHGFEKPVVVKRILPAHAGREDLAELFVAEAKLMTRLAHPNIVEVYDFGRGEHRDYYLVLELVDGLDLGRLVRAYTARSEPFPAPLALFIASQVLRGLHHAHTRLADEGSVIVHRDVSPSNVLLSTEGEVKVADFGVALVHGGARAASGVVGKPGYMAPEQSLGGAVDARADVYAVGVVLHQLLGGRLPSEGMASIDAAIDAILARALAVDPAARFPTARAMAQAIEALRDDGRRIATADDLAEAVRAAKRALPAEGRKVIALGSPSSPDEDEAPRELTRAGMGFTLRFPVRADATTRRDGIAEPPVESSRTFDGYAAPEPRTERIEGAWGGGRLGRVPGACEGNATGRPTGAPPFETEPPAPPSVGGDRTEPEPAAGVAVDDARPRRAGRDAPDARRDGAVRRAAIAVVLAAGVVGAIAFAIRTPAPTPIAPAASTSPPVVAAPPVVVTAVTVVPPSALPPAPPSPSARPSTSAPSPRVASRAAPTATATATAATPVDDCTGKVHFSSDDSWDVAGGPSPTQTPGVVVWRCGTYSLTARYRPDPTETRSVTVQVKADRTAEVSLRLR